jgi:hypothetical protein
MDTAKNRLQEHFQKLKQALPSYVTDINPTNPDSFQSTLCIYDQLFIGYGTSKKEAEKNAAVNALHFIDSQREPELKAEFQWAEFQWEHAPKIIIILDLHGMHKLASKLVHNVVDMVNISLIVITNTRHHSAKIFREDRYSNQAIWYEYIHKHPDIGKATEIGFTMEVGRLLQQMSERIFKPAIEPRIIKSSTNICNSTMDIEPATETTHKLNDHHTLASVCQDSNRLIFVSNNSFVQALSSHVNSTTDFKSQSARNYKQLMDRIRNFS